MSLRSRRARRRRGALLDACAGLAKMGIAIPHGKLVGIRRVGAIAILIRIDSPGGDVGSLANRSMRDYREPEYIGGWVRFEWPEQPDAATLARDAEVLAVLDAIDRGEVPLELVRPDAVDPVFRTASGWGFVVFNDCGSWDYLKAYRRPGEEAWTGALSYEVPDPERDVDEPEHAPHTRYAGTAWWRPEHKERWHWRGALSWD